VDSGYCQTHRPSRHSTRYLRPSARQRYDGKRWREARASYLRRHPLCVDCMNNLRTTAATDVDHIIPHKGDKTLFFDEDNLQSLCHPCHSAKTARENLESGAHRMSGM
jgi:5-methylcytosine-specific restriction protein A